MKICYKILAICFILKHAFAISQTTTENYVFSKTYKVSTNSSIPNPTSSEADETITYFDGLGRPIQKIEVNKSGDGKSIILPLYYDQYDRQSIEYLPYPSSSTGLQYIPNAIQELLQFQDYQNQYPYSEKEYDNSQLNRIVKQSAPGLAWRMGSGHEIKFDQQLNLKNDNVYNFVVNRLFDNSTNSFKYSLICKGIYNDGYLLKKITKNENVTSNSNNGVVEEYIDNFGKTVLKRSYLHNETIDTYYVYDEVGNLIYVIPPKASRRIVSISSSNVPYTYTKTFSIQDFLLNNFENPITTGGGNMIVTIINSQISVNFNANWAGNAHFDLNKSFPLDAQYPLPDMVIGDVSFYYNSNTKYKLIIENNCLRFLDLTPNDPPFEFNSFINSNLTKPLNQNQFGTTTIYSPQVDYSLLDGLCYQYVYNINNLLIAKKIPNKTWEYIVYDKLNRVVATGPTFNPFGSEDNGWLHTKYDAFGRVAYTLWKASDEKIDNERRFDLQDLFNQSTTIFETLTGSNEDSYANPYSSLVIPKSDYLLLTVNFYDNYSFPGAPSSLPAQVGGNTVLTNAKGLQTGSWVRVLLDPGSTIGETSYTLFNYQGKTLKTSRTNYLGGYTTTESEIDFGGQLLQSTLQHRLSSIQNPVTIVEKFEYTPEGRLKNHTHTINNQPTEMLVANKYDALGKLIHKNVGGTDLANYNGLQVVDYSYNIRGWLKGINDIDNLAKPNDPNDLFAFKINYNQVEISSTSGVQPLFNGNISETFWRSSSDNVKRAYGYTYDDLNRMDEAFYVKTGFTTGTINNYREKATYDENGNILSMKRNGNLDNGYQEIEIDDLTYTYQPNSNLLVKVTDATLHPMGFKDDSADGTVTTDTSDDYRYDLMGNMISDENKNILKISYNHLNLPTYIEIKYKGTISYIYDSTGRKVRKLVQADVLSQNKLVEYADGFQYENNILQFFPTAEGYTSRLTTKIEQSGKMIKIPIEELPEDQFSYVYNYTDHLGNIRLSYCLDPETQQLKIVEQNHYYPFGMRHTNYSGGKMVIVKDEEIKRMAPATEEFLTYKYKYNGKELQNELGLDVYDYGARNYDPAIGRWMNIDPLAEEGRRWSPYNYAMNNPVYFLDPDGMLSQSFIDDLMKKSQASETTWTNNNDGTFSSSTGEIADTGESNAESQHDGNGGADNQDPPGKKKVLEAKTSFLGKLWATLEPREWQDPKTGLVYQVNADGTIKGLRPLGGAGALEYLGGGGAFKIAQICGFYVRAKTFLSGGVYIKTIQSLVSLKEGTSMLKLLKAFEAEAKGAGAKQIVIKGIDIVNKKLFNVEVARRLGYTVEIITEKSITISKKL